MDDHQDQAHSIGVKYVCGLVDDINRNSRLSVETARPLTKNESKTTHLSAYAKITRTTSVAMSADSDDVLANIISEADTASLFDDTFIQGVFADVSNEKILRILVNAA